MIARGATARREVKRERRKVEIDFLINRRDDQSHFPNKGEFHY
jgi:hypothetical protein